MMRIRCSITSNFSLPPTHSNYELFFYGSEVRDVSSVSDNLSALSNSLFEIRFVQEVLYTAFYDPRNKSIQIADEFHLCRSISSLLCRFIQNFRMRHRKIKFIQTRSISFEHFLDHEKRNLAIKNISWRSISAPHANHSQSEHPNRKRSRLEHMW